MSLPKFTPSQITDPQRTGNLVSSWDVKNTFKNCQRRNSGRGTAGKILSPMERTFPQPEQGARIIKAASQKLEQTTRKHEPAYLQPEGASLPCDGFSTFPEGTFPNREGAYRNCEGASRNSEGASRNCEGASRNREGASRNCEGASFLTNTRSFSPNKSTENHNHQRLTIKTAKTPSLNAQQPTLN